MAPAVILFGEFNASQVRRLGEFRPDSRHTRTCDIRDVMERDHRGARRESLNLVPALLLLVVGFGKRKVEWTSLREQRVEPFAAGVDPRNLEARSPRSVLLELRGANDVDIDGAPVFPPS